MLLSQMAMSLSLLWRSMFRRNRAYLEAVQAISIVPSGRLYRARFVLVARSKPIPWKPNWTPVS
jgi:hypothetical protein